MTRRHLFHLVISAFLAKRGLSSAPPAPPALLDTFRLTTFCELPSRIRWLHSTEHFLYAGCDDGLYAISPDGSFELIEPRRNAQTVQASLFYTSAFVMSTPRVELGDDGTVAGLAAVKRDETRW